MTTGKLEQIRLIFEAVFSVSCSFMMPISTPPNLIVFATKRVQMKDIITSGFILNLVSIAVATLVSVTLVPAGKTKYLIENCQ